MKKLIFSLLLLMATATAGAQTIHWLTFIDTEDANVGAIDKTGRQVLYSRFINVVNAALHDKGYRSSIHDIYDSALSPERCKREVENLSVGSNDIVVFYYIGHGTHARNETNRFPQMLMGRGWESQNKFIPLKWVHDELKTKGARLTVTIGMCCNVVQVATAKNAPMFSVNYGNVELTDTERSAIQKMFLGYTGDFLLSSASVGQSSLGGQTPLGAMDIFTAMLVTAFEDMAYEDKLNWEDLFSVVKTVIHKVTNGKQTPTWDNNLRTASQPSPKPISKPVQKTPTTTTPSTNTTPSTGSSSNGGSLNLNDPSAVANYITSYLDCIIDKRNSFEKREAAASELKQIFTSDALIKMLPQDGNTVIDREDITTFLGRISTSRVLEKVAPVAYKVSGGKISQLNVRECYSK